MRLGEKKKLSTNGLRYMILWGIIIVMIVIFSLASPQFLRLSTMMNVIRQTAALSICAIGMTLIILTGGIDLSAGSIIAVAPAVGALLMQAMGGGSSVGVAVVGFVSTIVAAVIVGLINGFLVGRCHISAFMATLATQFAARGVTLKLTNANRVVIDSDIYNYLGQGVLFKIGRAKVPFSIILVVVCFAVAFFLFNKTTFGRKTYAVGGNAVASRASGITVERQIMLVYMFAALTYALGSFITAGRATSAQPLAGQGFEFEIITAVVIGGTSLAGGVGTISGTLLGAILVGIITTGLGMVDVQPYVNYCVKGALILGAVLLDMNLGKLSDRKSAKSQLDKKQRETAATATAVHGENHKVAQMISENKQTSLKLEHITKTFPGVKALDDVSLEIKRGKVHALMGENGAGKSTLMKVLSGVYSKDGGSITVDGLPIEIHSPVDSVNMGIAVIYQELAMVPELPITQNIFIGKELVGRSKFFLDLKKMSARSKELLGHFGLNINVNKRAKSYTVGQLQMVEIAKAIDSNAWVVVMDEPTAAITESDKERLFDIIRELKAKGIAIVYISHRLSEIFEIADEVSILRDGCLVSTQDISEVTEASLIKNMVGHAVNDIFDREKNTSDDNAVVLEVKNLYRKGVFEPISFKVRAGEVLGFSGLIGAGRTEIMRCIFGLDKPDGGEIYLNGEKLNIHNPMDAVRAGICLVSEDRRKEGIVPAMSVRENITLPSLNWISKGGVIDKKQDLEICDDYVKSLAIKTPSNEQLIGNLSGGNQQKCCLAKWLARTPKLIILDEPTRGIDVGAKAEIHNLIDELTKQGMAVVMISSELPEIMGASDRIIVLYEGQKTAEFNCTTDAITQEKLMEAASGIAIGA